MNADIQNIIRQGESINIEFKESKSKLNKDVYESVCAFLNRFGGHLFLGVKNNGEIVGVDSINVEQIKKDFVTAINNPQKIAPTFYTTVEEYEIDGKTVLYIRIPNSSQVHRTNGRIFDRNEDADIDITDNTALVSELYNRKNNSYAELKAFPFVSIDDLDKDTISRIRIMARNQRGGEHPWDRLNDLELLKSANLYGKDQTSGKEGINLAGILLLGTQQLIFSALPHYKTDAIVRIDNTDRYDDREIVLENLVKSFDKLIAFTEKHLNDNFYLEGNQRISVRNKIFREVCSNLLIHREFTSAYPAKLIIEKGIVRTENANKPHGFGEIDANHFSPYPKNPAISKFFREIGLADELGSGIRNITKYLEIYSGEKPEFIEGDVFQIIIPVGNKSAITHQDTHQDTHKDTHQDTHQDNPIILKLLKFCETPKSRIEMQEYVQLKDKVNFKKNYLLPMIEDGLLEMTIPNKPSSRNQKYKSKKTVFVNETE